MYYRWQNNKQFLLSRQQEKENDREYILRVKTRYTKLESITLKHTEDRVGNFLPSSFILGGVGIPLTITYISIIKN